MSAPPSGLAEGGSAAWPEVDGPAEPEDGAAEAAASELDGSGEVEDGAAEGAETLPYFSMYRAMIAFSVGVPVYDAFCSAPVSCGKCLPGTSTLTALETVSGPGYLGIRCAEGIAFTHTPR